MQSEAKTVKTYLAEIPADRSDAFLKLRKAILDNLPKGLEECMSYGMIGYVVPHSKYPAGYHCDPKLPLPFLSLASQKNTINFYHMGMYADQKLLDWFVAEYPKHSKAKLDMGKSCVRFKKFEEIPHKLIGELIKKMSVNDWIALYEKNYKR
jgi:hypothetical protein